MSGLVMSPMQLSVFLCVLCVYDDVWSGQESDATIRFCNYVCMVMSGQHTHEPVLLHKQPCYTILTAV